MLSEIQGNMILYFGKVEPFGSASFTESTALSSVCSITIRLHAWCLVSSAKKTLAGFRWNLFFGV